MFNFIEQKNSKLLKLSCIYLNVKHPFNEYCAHMKLVNMNVFIDGGFIEPEGRDGETQKQTTTKRKDDERSKVS